MEEEEDAEIPLLDDSTDLEEEEEEEVLEEGWQRVVGESFKCWTYFLCWKTSGTTVGGGRGAVVLTDLSWRDFLLTTPKSF